MDIKNDNWSQKRSQKMGSDFEFYCKEIHKVN